MTTGDDKDDGQPASVRYLQLDQASKTMQKPPAQRIWSFQLGGVGGYLYEATMVMLTRDLERGSKQQRQGQLLWCSVEKMNI